MTNPTLKVAVCQWQPRDTALPEVVDLYCDRLRGLDEDVDLVILPELWNVGYFNFDDYEAYAEPLAGPTMTRMAAVAADLKVTLVAGSVLERAPEGRRLLNTTTVFGPTGESLATYRKMHVFGFESRECELVSGGTQTTELDLLAGTTVGLGICYDLRFPEFFRSRRVPPEVFVLPATWPAARIEHWRTLLRSRAIENQAYVVGCNAAGENAGVALGGGSCVIGPEGDVVAEAHDEPEVLVASLDLSRPSRVRRSFPVLHDRVIDPPARPAA